MKRKFIYLFIHIYSFVVHYKSCTYLRTYVWYERTNGTCVCYVRTFIISHLHNETNETYIFLIWISIWIHIRTRMRIKRLAGYVCVWSGEILMSNPNSCVRGKTSKQRAFHTLIIKLDGIQSNIVSLWIQKNMFNCVRAWLNCVCVHACVCVSIESK